MNDLAEAVARRLVALVLERPAFAEALAIAIGPYVLEAVERRTAGPTADRWLTTAEAAEHLGLTRNALHRHTSARTIPFEQDAPGGKCWFKRSELDAWRAGAWRP